MTKCPLYCLLETWFKFSLDPLKGDCRDLVIERYVGFDFFIVSVKVQDTNGRLPLGAIHTFGFRGFAEAYPETNDAMEKSLIYDIGTSLDCRVLNHFKFPFDDSNVVIVAKMLEFAKKRYMKREPLLNSEIEAACIDYEPATDQSAGGSK